MLIGATHVLVRSFEPVSVIEALEREQITAGRARTAKKRRGPSWCWLRV